MQFERDINLLEISDEQVKGDWRYGLQRAIARQLQKHGVVESGLHGSYNQFPSSTAAGSDAEHVYGKSWKKFSRLSMKCEIVSVSDIGDAEHTWYEPNSFDGCEPVEYTESGFSGRGVCSCGRSMEISWYGSVSEIDGSF